MPSPIAPSRAMSRGTLWFAAGAAVLLAAFLLARADASPLPLYGALVVGLYLASLGVERMIGAWWAARKTRATGSAERLGATGIVAMGLLISAAASGYGAYLWRKPYWEAVRGMNAGNEAAARLKAIAQRHAALLESRPAGAIALESWKTSAMEALGLKPDFTRALAGARTLSGGDSAASARAREDVQFFGLCLEWMDLYERVARAVREESLSEPPEEWTTTQNDVVERIRALQRTGT